MLCATRQLSISVLFLKTIAIAMPRASEGNTFLQLSSMYGHSQRNKNTPTRSCVSLLQVAGAPIFSQDVIHFLQYIRIPDRRHL